MQDRSPVEQHNSCTAHHPAPRRVYFPFYIFLEELESLIIYITVLIQYYYICIYTIKLLLPSTCLLAGQTWSCHLNISVDSQNCGFEEPKLSKFLWNTDLHSNTIESLFWSGHGNSRIRWFHSSVIVQLCEASNYSGMKWLNPEWGFQKVTGRVFRGGGDRH